MRYGPNDPISESEAAALFGVMSEFPALVLAVSGGPDSTALLWLAARWRDRLASPPKLVAVTIDHGLRPESAKEAAGVKLLADALDVEHRILRWTGPKPKTGIQEAARDARYRLLAQAARKAGAEHILTAHTLDDQAETVLFRMARGSGVSGLAGMSAVAPVPVAQGRGLWLLRPLLAVSKARLVTTLEAAKVSYSRDPSNEDPRFARPRLRALLPALAQEGLTAERVGLLARRVARLEDTLVRTLNAAEKALFPRPWPAEGPVWVDLDRFLDLPHEIGLRLLARMIAAVGNEGAAELGQLETLHAEVMIAGSAGRNSERFRRTLAGALIALADGGLTVERAPPRRTHAPPRASGAKRPHLAPKRATRSAKDHSPRRGRMTRNRPIPLAEG